MGLKEKLHLLVDNCKDETMLENAIALLSENTHDWWSLLPEKEKSTTLQSLKELDGGKGIMHQEVMQQAWQKIGK